MRIGRRVLAGWILVLLVVLQATIARAQTPSAMAAPPPVSFAEYQTLLDDLKRAIIHPITPADARVLRARLGKAQTVSLPDGASFRPDNASIERAFAEVSRAKKPRRLDPNTVEQIRLLVALTTADKVTRSDTNERNLASAILNGREFRDAARPKIEKSWWDELQEKMEKAISDFFRSLFRHGPSLPGKGLDWLARVVQWILIVFAVIVVAIGLYYLVRWAANRAPTGRRRMSRSGDFDLLESGIADPFSESETLAAQGDYRGALRMAYIAALRRLSHKGLLILQENKTNWEYQRDLRRRSQSAYDALLPATRLFDTVWYGQRQATREEFTAVAAAYNRLGTIDGDDAKTTAGGGAKR